jgi:hypothetical protein
VGNGGFPSNHSAVVSSMATLIALREGIGHPAFGVAVTLAFIVMIDANSLRQHVGRRRAEHRLERVLCGLAQEFECRLGRLGSGRARLAEPHGRGGSRTLLRAVHRGHPSEQARAEPLHAATTRHPGRRRSGRPHGARPHFSARRREET